MKRNVAADYIRALSILYIIGFWHLQAYGRPVGWIEQVSLPNYLTITALALFVFMSGSFIGAKEMSAPGAIRRFYVDRFWTVYLPFVGATLLFVALKLGEVVPLLKGLLLIGMLDEPAALTLWFANMIVLFYLLAPLLIRLRQKPVAFGALCAAVIAALGAVEATTGAIDQRLLIYFPVFAAGIALGPRRIADPRLMLAGVALAALGIVLPDLGVTDLQYSFQLAPFALGAALALTSFLYRMGSGWNLSVGLEALVSASYFAYLLHRPIYKLTMKVLPFQGAWGVTAELLLVGLPATLLVAWALQKAYTQMTLRIRDQGIAGLVAR